MQRFFGSLFKPTHGSVANDSELGPLTVVDGEWRFQVPTAGKLVEASIPDVNGCPCPEARRVAANSLGTLTSLWNSAIEFTVEELKPLNPRFDVEPSEFVLEAVSFHPSGAFEGGEVVFWFRLCGDANGSYFVPLHDGVPVLWHRDS